MRSRRFSFLAGWIAVILLALAGFAAFGTTQSGDRVADFEAASASQGHTAGVYAGLTFALFADDTTSALTAETAAEAPTTPSTSQPDPTIEGTIAPASGWLSEVQVRALVARYFKAEDINSAVMVAWCESRFDPDSVNLRTGAIGLFQHLPQYWAERAENAGFAGSDPTDPVASTAAAAWAVYNGGGWDIFACRA